MDEIKVSCFTNIKSTEYGFYNASWPETLQVRPMIGEKIAAKSGLILTIHSITHEYDGTLKIELHL
jgi:hypothetical protein